MQRTHRGVALDTVFDENGTRCGILLKIETCPKFELIFDVLPVILNISATAKNYNSRHNIHATES